eukprot:CAMPEP_0197530038 /NCGR_PEP_ID=MMETSP1318-20131121/30436_1 /TAXON_ID=552666 /ORGANISM="Partenskyella glossopodia, Strain RCC365" /LENGTH=251 /DNA_ID=CAMNT_0043085703 /DNA_START=265 /DNA_END=1020 /DNA_ORIENTATION=-
MKSIDEAYVILDYSLCALLLVELVIRALATQKRFFYEFCNYIDMFVLVLLIATSLVMHRRFDVYLGKRRTRRTWALAVYFVRYLAQVGRLLMVWREARAANQMADAIDCMVRIPDQDQINMMETNVKADMTLKNFANGTAQIQPQRSSYYGSTGTTFTNGINGTNAGGGRKGGGSASLHAPQTNAGGPSRYLYSGSSNGTDADAETRRYTAISAAAEQMAVAFDITPLDSPSTGYDEGSWTDVLTPRLDHQ